MALLHTKVYDRTDLADFSHYRSPIFNCRTKSKAPDVHFFFQVPRIHDSVLTTQTKIIHKEIDLEAIYRCECEKSI